jgi:hypothetical protein
MTATLRPPMWDLETEFVIRWLESEEGEDWSRYFHHPIRGHTRQPRGATDPGDWFTPLAEVYGGTRQARNPNAHPWDQSKWRPRVLNRLFDPTQGGTP